MISGQRRRRDNGEEDVQVEYQIDFPVEIS